jgi:hypothetical protein
MHFELLKEGTVAVALLQDAAEVVPETFHKMLIEGVEVADAEAKAKARLSNEGEAVQLNDYDELPLRAPFFLDLLAQEEDLLQQGVIPLQVEDQHAPFGCLLRHGLFQPLLELLLGFHLRNADLGCVSEELTVLLIKVDKLVVGVDDEVVSVALGSDAA